MKQSLQELQLIYQELKDNCLFIDLNKIPFFKSGSKLLPKMKKGSGIHIKKENRGKFTASAKRAGQSVQEHAHSVMRNPNATSLQKKRANFAILAKKWHKN